MSRHRRKYPYTRGVPWGQCHTCNSDVPVTQIFLTRKYGWQCRNCADMGPDRDDYLAAYEPRLGESSRQSAAPLTNTLTEGTD